MKKFLTVILAFVCALGISVGLISCKEKEKKLQIGEEYFYAGISFKKAKGITLDDISSFVPSSVTGHKIDSVKDFENLLKENIDTYFIERRTENGRERIPLKTSILSVKITEGNPYVAHAYTLWISCENQENPYQVPALRDGDTFTIADSLSSFPDFYYADGAIHYDLQFNEKFSVVYNYKLK